MNTNRNLTPFTNLAKRFFDDNNIDYITTMFENRGNSGLINILDKDDEYLIEVSAPGLKKEDIKIDLEDNVLKISSDVNDKKESSIGGYTRKEFYRSSFERQFTIPKDVNKTDISATMTDGILIVSAPKIKETEKKKNSIKISIK
jgi:HSP20 family protein